MEIFLSNGEISMKWKDFYQIVKFLSIGNDRYLSDKKDRFLS